MSVPKMRGRNARQSGMALITALIMLVVALLTNQRLASPHGWDWAILVCLAVLPGSLGHFLTN